MGLLLYPIFIAIAFVFYALIILTVLVVWLGFYLIVIVLTIAAHLIGSQWRPRKPGRATVSRRPPPQARFSHHR